MRTSVLITIVVSSVVLLMAASAEAKMKKKFEGDFEFVDEVSAEC